MMEVRRVRLVRYQETDPAGLEDIRDSREDTTPQGAVYSERICTERHPE